MKLVPFDSLDVVTVGKTSTGKGKVKLNFDTWGDSKFLHVLPIDKFGLTVLEASHKDRLIIGDIAFSSTLTLPLPNNAVERVIKLTNREDSRIVRVETTVRGDDSTLVTKVNHFNELYNEATKGHIYTHFRHHRELQWPPLRSAGISEIPDWTIVNLNDSESLAKHLDSFGVVYGLESRPFTATRFCPKISTDPVTHLLFGNVSIPLEAPRNFNVFYFENKIGGLKKWVVVEQKFKSSDFFKLHAFDTKFVAFKSDDALGTFKDHSSKVILVPEVELFAAVHENVTVNVDNPSLDLHKLLLKGGNVVTDSTHDEEYFSVNPNHKHKAFITKIELGSEILHAHDIGLIHSVRKKAVADKGQEVAVIYSVGDRFFNRKFSLKDGLFFETDFVTYPTTYHSLIDLEHSAIPVDFDLTTTLPNEIIKVQQNLFVPRNALLNRIGNVSFEGKLIVADDSNCKLKHVKFFNGDVKTILVYCLTLSNNNKTTTVKFVTIENNKTKEVDASTAFTQIAAVATNAPQKSLELNLNQEPINPQFNVVTTGGTKYISLHTASTGALWKKFLFKNITVELTDGSNILGVEIAKQWGNEKVTLYKLKQGVVVLEEFVRDLTDEFAHVNGLSLLQPHVPHILNKVIFDDKVLVKSLLMCDDGDLLQSTQHTSVVTSGVSKSGTGHVDVKFRLHLKLGLLYHLRVNFKVLNNKASFNEAFEDLAERIPENWKVVTSQESKLAFPITLPQNCAAGVKDLCLLKDTLVLPTNLTANQTAADAWHYAFLFNPKNGEITCTETKVKVDTTKVVDTGVKRSFNQHPTTELVDVHVPLGGKPVANKPDFVSVSALRGGIWITRIIPQPKHANKVLSQQEFLSKVYYGPKLLTQVLLLGNLNILKIKENQRITVKQDKDDKDAKARNAIVTVKLPLQLGKKTKVDFELAIGFSINGEKVFLDVSPEDKKLVIFPNSGEKNPTEDKVTLEHNKWCASKLELGGTSGNKDKCLIRRVFVVEGKGGLLFNFFFNASTSSVTFESQDFNNGDNNWTKVSESAKHFEVNDALVKVVDVVIPISKELKPFSIPDGKVTTETTKFIDTVHVAFVKDNKKFFNFKEAVDFLISISQWADVNKDQFHERLPTSEYTRKLLIDAGNVLRSLATSLRKVVNSSFGKKADNCCLFDLGAGILAHVHHKIDVPHWDLDTFALHETEHPAWSRGVSDTGKYAFLLPLVLEDALQFLNALGNAHDLANFLLTLCPHASTLDANSFVPVQNAIKEDQKNLVLQLAKDAAQKLAVIKSVHEESSILELTKQLPWNVQGAFGLAKPEVDKLSAWSEALTNSFLYLRWANESTRFLHEFYYSFQQIGDIFATTHLPFDKAKEKLAEFGFSVDLANKQPPATEEAAKKKLLLAEVVKQSILLLAKLGNKLFHIAHNGSDQVINSKIVDVIKALEDDRKFVSETKPAQPDQDIFKTVKEKLDAFFQACATNNKTELEKSLKEFFKLLKQKLIGDHIKTINNPLVKKYNNLLENFASHMNDTEQLKTKLEGELDLRDALYPDVTVAKLVDLLKKEHTLTDGNTVKAELIATLEKFNNFNKPNVSELDAIFYEVKKLFQAFLQEVLASHLEHTKNALIKDLLNYVTQTTTKFKEEINLDIFTQILNIVGKESKDVDKFKAIADKIVAHANKNAEDILGETLALGIADMINGVIRTGDLLDIAVKVDECKKAFNTFSVISSFELFPVVEKVLGNFVKELDNIIGSQASEEHLLQKLESIKAKFLNPTSFPLSGNVIKELIGEILEESNEPVKHAKSTPEVPAAISPAPALPKTSEAEPKSPTVNSNTVSDTTPQITPQNAQQPSSTTTVVPSVQNSGSAASGSASANVPSAAGVQQPANPPTLPAAASSDATSQTKLPAKSVDKNGLLLRALPKVEVADNEGAKGKAQRLKTGTIRFIQISFRTALAVLSENFTAHLLHHTIELKQTINAYASLEDGISKLIKPTLKAFNELAIHWEGLFDDDEIVNSDYLGELESILYHIIGKDRLRTHFGDKIDATTVHDSKLETLALFHVAGGDEGVFNAAIELVKLSIKVSDKSEVKFGLTNEVKKAFDSLIRALIAWFDKHVNSVFKKALQTQFFIDLETHLALITSKEDKQVLPKDKLTGFTLQLAFDEISKALGILKIPEEIDDVVEVVDLVNLSARKTDVLLKSASFILYNLIKVDAAAPKDLSAIETIKELCLKGLPKERKVEVSKEGHDLVVPPVVIPEADANKLRGKEPAASPKVLPSAPAGVQTPSLPAKVATPSNAATPALDKPVEKEVDALLTEDPFLWVNLELLHGEKFKTYLTQFKTALDKNYEEVKKTGTVLAIKNLSIHFDLFLYQQHYILITGVKPVAVQAPAQPAEADATIATLVKNGVPVSLEVTETWWDNAVTDVFGLVLKSENDVKVVSNAADAGSGGNQSPGVNSGSVGVSGASVSGNPSTVVSGSSAGPGSSAASTTGPSTTVTTTTTGSPSSTTLTTTVTSASSHGSTSSLGSS